ncbi:hypothetical protein [Pedobacter sandarakinus]|uniref:hypothetical protein n=1 Tax=Pedobacter sandarakinus TaxID=353156 RepID=UPI0022461016|nr:hypothetical protein [Pedobacter sandarakinus]MCX2572948.1 hypothetical protein [Pedobacter sandarakinus]
MKRTIPIVAMALMSLAACQNNTNSNGEETKNSQAENNGAECFEYVNNKDTANLKLNFDDDKITGTLAYNLFEKDKNDGVIAGIVKGDTLIADYTFNSEGTTSTRQVVWLKQDGKLVEGFGDIEEVDGKTMFKNVSSLTFGKSMVFTKTECN